MSVRPGLRFAGSAVAARSALFSATLFWASSLTAQTAEQETRLERIEAIQAIEKLQFAYGYYQNRFLFDEPPTLFTNANPEVHYDGAIWRGSSGLKRLWGEHFPRAFGTSGRGPVAGLMFDQPLFQGVIDIAPDGSRATGRFQTIGRYALYGKDERWVGGVYDNDYVREGGVWKIKVMRYCTTWAAPYNRGWIEADAPTDLPWMSYDDNGHPDELTDADCANAYPGGGMIPFRYPHPVTGQMVGADS